MARQIIQAGPTEQSLRNRAFQDGIDQAIAGGSGLFNSIRQGEQIQKKEEENIRQRAFKANDIISKLEQGGQTVNEEGVEAVNNFVETGDLKAFRSSPSLGKLFKESSKRAASANTLKQQDASLNRDLKRAQIAKTKADAKDPFGLNRLQAQQQVKLKAEKEKLADPQFVLSKLGAEAKSKIGSIASGLQALEGTKSAISQGFGPEHIDVNTPLIGRFQSDTPFTQNQRLLSEVVGRLQSGGAINKEEEKRFIELGPRPGDTPEIAQQKIAQQRAFLENKLTAFGLSSNDLGDFGFSTTPVQVENNSAAQSSVPPGFDVASIPGVDGLPQQRPAQIPFIQNAQASEQILQPERVQQRQSRIQELLNKRGF